MESKKADLHIHSHYSDSDLSIQEIFNQAKEKGINSLAITDHDTTEGTEEAINLSKTYGIEFIEGIELSAEYNNAEIHILGYFIDSANKSLVKALENVKDLRKERLIKMAEKINSLGGKVDIDELISRINEKVATRLHLALYMVKKRQVTSIWEAFRKYLSFGRPAYIARIKFSVKEAITLIKEAGGLAVLAHPHFLPSKEWIAKFRQWGLDGIEVKYPRYTPSMIEQFSQIAEKFELLKSGGSDSHGSYKEFTGVGKVWIPYSWVEKLKNAKRNLLYKENI
ncbi:MAG: PHP domain-containing protein [Candidatus Omnitrophica bacterium]|nr:PHP domain-containing protein [Candidatus Omnitrophota bacterium]